MIVINDTNKTGYLAFCNHIIPYLKKRFYIFVGKQSIIQNQL